MDEAEYRWEELGGYGAPSGYILVRHDRFRQAALMRVYDTLDGRWAAEPWSGDPPADPPTFYTLAEAKVYCEVTAKLLCGS